ncbi:SpaA isopeptide-forming pilin-related protein [uncultured Oscillibacter sp.]|uniref:MSCRAMM family protein n=1 Tax=uncultured Oscillibacter sp. TaxID=876091 RepID=UPI002626E7F8|nr:SpaA isopeptide-forming pilin-related protein [uncultured Oscillibacter sp.]
MNEKHHSLRTRLTALLLALICVLGLFPTTAFAAGDTITLKEFGHSGVAYESAALGRCTLHEMTFKNGNQTTTGFCGTKGGDMGNSLQGQTWGNKRSISDPTVETMMAYYYAHSTGVFTDEAIALGVNDVWNAGYRWYMNAWVQACIWRYQQGSMSDPVAACAEELMAVYNSLEGTHYTSIDQKQGETSFRDRTQYILDLGSQGVWGKCAVYEYTFTGAGSSSHPAGSVQKIILGDLTVEHIEQEEYVLIVKKVDATNPSKGLPGAGFHVESTNGAFSKDIITGENGVYRIAGLSAATYAVTETAPPPGGYQIDSTAPQYVTLPSNGNNTVTVTFRDSTTITGEGSIRKVDADNPSRGLAGAVIKITGVDNSFVGTYVTGEGGYLTDVPWDTMPIGSYEAEEVTPPEGFTKSPDVNKCKQTFVWDGKSDVSLVFENDSKVKIQLIKLDDSNNPLPGAVFNIVKDGQIIGTEATLEDGSITVTDVEEGMYAFVEVSAPAPFAKLTEPVIAHVDQATINGGGTVTVSAADKKLPNLTILKRDSQTGDVIPNTHFEIRGIHYGYHNDVTTGPDGKAVLTAIPSDSYEVTEKSVPDPWVVGDEPTQTIWLEAGDDKELIFDNMKQPLLKIAKVEKGTNPAVYVPNTNFLIEAIDGDYRHNVTTGQDGTVELRVAPGSYKITEQSVPEPYFISDTPSQTISLNPGDEKEVRFENQKKPLLTLKKIDADSQAPIPKTVLTVKALDGTYQDDWTTGPDGTVSLRVEPGTYEITEKSVPAPYYLPDKDADRTQTITLSPGDEKTLVFRNRKAPELTVFKENSITGEPIEHAKFSIRYTSNGEASEAPATVDYGEVFTDSRGEIRVHELGKRLYPGEFTITELEPADGFQLKEPITQTVIIHGNESKTVRFQNTPLSALVVWKYDSITGAPVEGCIFQVRYMSGTSGTGGTVIGTYKTGPGGSFTINRLKAGAYLVEELASDGDHVMDTAPQTAYISGKEQDVVQLYFGNSPKGSLLIKKIDASSHEPLSDCEFFVTDSHGTMLGDANGKFVTDSAGTILISNIAPGTTIVARETRAKENYILDDVPQTTTIKAGQTVTLEFRNQPKGSVTLYKFSSLDRRTPLEGVGFKITFANGQVVDNIGGKLSSNGIYYTDSEGQINISGVIGTLVFTEVSSIPGYLIDENRKSQTIVVNPDDHQSVYFYNQPIGNLVIKKMSSTTKEPLSDVVIRVTRTDGTVVGESNGEFRTDEAGFIKIPVEPGSYIVQEVKSKPGFLLDDTPKTIEVKGPGTYNIELFNQPLGSLVIHKYSSLDRKTPLAGVQFKVTYAPGCVVDNENSSVSSNGIYYTGPDGTITISGIVGTVVITEQATIPGYTIDPETRSQTIVVNPDDVQHAYFYNSPKNTLIIEKYLEEEGSEHKPLKGVTFLVTDSSGAVVGNSNGEFISGDDGRVVIPGVEPGSTISVREIKVPEGVVLDGIPKTIKISDDGANILRFYNKKVGTLVVRKLDKISKEPLSGVEFELTYAEGGYVDDANGHLSSKGLYTTNANGEIRVPVVGTVVVKEVKSLPTHVIDEATRIQTVTVNPADTQTITVYNEPLCSLTLTKKDAVSGKPVPNTEFTLRDGDGNLIGRYTTGADGTVTVTGLIPNSTVVVVETKVPSNYVLDPTPRTIIVRNGSNSVSSGGTTSGGSSSGSGSGGSHLDVENIPKTTLTIEKYLETETGNVPLKGVTFLVTDSSGAVVGSSNGEYITGEDGRIVIPNLEPGITVTAKELKVPDGVVLDSTPKSIEIKGGEGGQTLRFVNQKTGYLVIKKLDKLTSEPLAGVEFKLSYASGEYVDDNFGHLSSLGLFKTDANGEIRVPVVGTVVVEEIKTLPNYTIDPGTKRQVVTVNPADTQTLTVYNTPDTNLTIQKYIEDPNAKGTGTEPLAGVTFLICDSGGTPLGPNNGEFVTDQYGQIRLSVAPGTTVTAKEVKTASNEFVLDSTPQSILIKEGGEGQQLTFYNKRVGGLELIKVSASDETKRIPNTTFEIRKMDGALVETVTTDSTGRVHVDLDAGDFYAVEIKAGEGFKLDSTPHYFSVQDNQCTTLTVTNKAFSGILIHKVDSVTKKGIYGVSFLLYDSTNTPVGQYTSDNQGYVYIESITTAGRFYLRELENEGYITDTQMKTVYVKPGETTLVEWENTPISGQIQITKKSADYNSTNGLPAGTLLEGAVFEIYDKANNLVDTIRSDGRGLAVSRQIPLGRYTIREVKAPANYGVNETPLTAYLEHEGQIVRFEVTNKSMSTGVSITKTGPAEVMAGQPVRYVFSNIANSSNVRLDNFYWRDTLPAEVRLEKIVTGTYNFPGVYKITYRVNGGEPQTLADNLSTQKNYTLAASATALGLASNERVTEIMFVFGQVPGGFARVEKPMIHCKAVSSIAAGSFVNKADVGGTYQGVWVQAVSRWVTTVYGKKPSVPKLPRTGY